jgi:predicted ribosome quality control (RQC) complex YloA/Tae2 family protein
VVLKTAGRTPPATSVEQAAELAAYYSRGRDSTTVPVDVVPARNVHRIKGGKPGLVRISGGGYATITVRPRAEATRASS